MFIFSENKTAYLDASVEKHLADAGNCLFSIISTIRAVKNIS